MISTVMRTEVRARPVTPVAIERRSLATGVMQATAGQKRGD